MQSLEQILNQKYGIDSEAVKKSQSFNTPIESYVKDAAQLFIDLMQEKLDNDNVNATLSLRQGLGFEPKVSDEDGYELVFTSEEQYAEIRDQGISGTEVKRDTPFQFTKQHPSTAMVQSIEQWMNAKGFQLPSWAVATNILKRGYEGAHFITDTFNDNNLNSFNEGIATVMMNSAVGRVEKVIPEFE